MQITERIEKGSIKLKLDNDDLVKLIPVQSLIPRNGKVTNIHFCVNLSPDNQANVEINKETVIEATLSYELK